MLKENKYITVTRVTPQLFRFVFQHFYSVKLLIDNDMFLISAHVRLYVRKADFNNDQYVNDFGISINDKMVDLQGRVLQAPKLQYGGKVIVFECFFFLELNPVWRC